MVGEGALTAVEAFTALIGAAVLVGLVARRFKIPYTVALVLFGLGVSATAPSVGLNITPELVLAVLLPGLVFEAAYQTNFDTLRRTFGGITLLAVPGVVLSAAVVAIVLNVFAGLRLDLAFVVGAMVSATDPAAVIATFKRLGAPGRLTTMVEGESLFNDGTAIVIFVIALRDVVAPIPATEAILSFVMTVTASLLLGAVVGFLASRIVARVDDHLIELTISVVVAYGTYLLADRLGESGIIATVVAGITFGTYGRRIGLSARTQEALDAVWEFLAFLLTALVFLLVGLAISPQELVAAAAPIAWGVVAILIGRALAIYLLLGGGSRLLLGKRRTVSAGWLHVLFWSGLRGAVAVALALSLPLDIPQRQLLQTIVFGIVLFTLVVQGTTIDFVTRHFLADEE